MIEPSPASFNPFDFQASKPKVNFTALSWHLLTYVMPYLWDTQSNGSVLRSETLDYTSPSAMQSVVKVKPVPARARITTPY